MPGNSSQATNKPPIRGTGKTRGTAYTNGWPTLNTNSRRQRRLPHRELAEHYQRKAQARIQDANAGDGHAILPAYSAILRLAKIARRVAVCRGPDADYIAGIALIARNAADAAAKPTTPG